MEHHDNNYRENIQGENEARAAVMAPVLWKIFWLAVVANVLSLLGLVPALNRIVTIFGYVASVMVAGLVLTMKDVDRRFYTAGCCGIAAALINLSGLLLGSSPDLTTVLSLVASVFSLVSMYNELTTLGDVVGKADRELGLRWHNLWKWRMIGLAISVGSTLLVVFVAVALAAVIIVGAAVAAIVLGILQMVYYYKTAKLYDGMIAK